MVARRKKKYETGEGARYMTRKAALKYLQLSLKDFRKLCILKGIYPREPNNRKKAQKGKLAVRTLYHKKDIQFLLHEPIIWKLRDIKIFARKIGRAHGMKEYEMMRQQMNKHPTMNIDHIVKERYPTFMDALQDLDDCLTLCFLFSTFPSLRHVPKDQTALCRRLTVEFMHAVIQARALRKVFISIKGYYFQAEFKGQTITWIIPHYFAFQPFSKDDVDFKIMTTFVQFYTVMLGFVNFHLYHDLNLLYPPKLTGYGINDIEKKLTDEEEFNAERISALNIPLCKLNDEVEEPAEIDQFPTGEGEEFEQRKIEMSKIEDLKKLFEGLKFYLNREVPREPLVFIIRCFGGQVSWDKDFFVGATFDESDETINYQIVDRPSMDKQYLSRYYVQPQWIFDSVNRRELLPVEKYLIGAVLPPHLSPFVNEGRDQVYMPPEERELKDPNFKRREYTVGSEEEQEEKSKNENVVEKDNEAMDESEEEEDIVEDEDDNSEDDENSEESDNSEDGNEGGEEKSDPAKEKLKNMAVTPGQVYKEDPLAQKKQESQEHRLRVKMIPRKHKKLYKSMMKGQEKRKKEIWLLRKKRRTLDISEAKEKNRKSKTE